MLAAPPTGRYTLAATATTTAFDPFALNDADAVSLGVVATGVEDEPVADAPRGVVLRHPQPNPAHGPVTLRYGLPLAGRASLAVFDLLGREVARVVDDTPAAGWHAATWDGAVASGVYVVRLAVESGGQTVVRTRRVVVVR